MIEVRNLVKEFRIFKRDRGLKGALKNLFFREYENLKVVDDVSFTIDKGEIVGYIGPNGAGKTTTIKCLIGILTPTSGVITVNGMNPQSDRYAHLKNLGVVFGQRTQLWWDLSVYEAYNMLKKIYELSKDRFDNQLERLVYTFNLDEILYKPVRELSLGQRMKAEFAASMLHSPKVLFLDEPTIGLDIIAKDRFREYIKQVNREFDTTILITTHDLSDIEYLCRRVLIIDKGKIIYDGWLDKLKEEFVTLHQIRIKFHSSVSDPGKLLTDVIKSRFDDVECGVSDEGQLLVSYNSRRLKAASIMRAVMDKADDQVEDFLIQYPDISSIIKAVYNKGT